MNNQGFGGGGGPMGGPRGGGGGGGFPPNNFAGGGGGPSMLQPSYLGGGGPNATATANNDPLFEFVPGNEMKTRDLMYRLVISQLFYDGFSGVAMQLINLLPVEPACPPSERLLHVVTLGLEREQESRHRVPTAVEQVLGPGIDLEFETELQSTAPEPALYETAYVTSHKGNCRAGAFSADGSLCATGSVDASIKVLDVDRMLAKSNQDLMMSSGMSNVGKNAPGEQGGHPVIRTLYDHLEEVTCLEFHPKDTILASGSRDCTVKLFDYSKASAKKASRTITESEQISSISFHPTGEFLLVGTEHEVIRLYDVNTSQCFVGSVPKHQHTAGVTSLHWSPDGKLYASASLDGSIKIWDGISSQCISSFANSHSGAEVCSVRFSRNGKYVLSSGKDSLVKLWELSTTRCLIAYTGAGATGKQEHRAQAVFNHSEDYVMFPDEATTSLCCWDARNASRKQLLSLGHNGVVRYIVHSPTSPAFLTCSDDFRARFWYKKTAVQ